MGQQVINNGLAAGDGLGESAHDAFEKVNENFDELYVRGISGAPDLSGSPAHGDLLQYDGTVSPPVWRPVNIAGAIDLDDLGDVTAPSPTNGQVLTWDATLSPPQWVAATPTGGGTLDGLTDVVAPSPGNGQYLVWNGTVSPGYWEPITLAAAATTLDQLTDVDLSTSPGPVNGDVLIYDATMSPPQWRPHAIPAAGTTHETVISTVTTSGSQTSVTFSSISGAYDELAIRVLGRSNTSADNDFVTAQINSDTGSNYAWSRSGSSEGSAFASGNHGQTAMNIGAVSAATSTAGYPGYFIARIPWYAQTTWKKTGFTLIVGTGSATNIYQALMAYSWNSTAAITDIVLRLGSGSSFVNGSIVQLVGITY